MKFEVRDVTPDEIVDFKYFRTRKDRRIHEYGYMELNDGDRFILTRRALYKFVKMLGLKVNELKRMDYKERDKTIMETLRNADVIFRMHYRPDHTVVVVASPRFTPIRHSEVLAKVNAVLGEPYSLEFKRGMFALWKIAEDDEHIYSLYIYNRNDARHSIKVGAVVKIKACGNLVFGRFKRVVMYHVGAVEKRLLPAVEEVASQVQGFKELIERAKSTYVEVPKVLDMCFQKLSYTYASQVRYRIGRYQRVSVYEAVYEITNTQRLTDSINVKMKIGELAYQLLNQYCASS